MFSVDDTFLEQAVSSVPKGSILLIEDIDCAFSREDEEDEGINFGFPPGMVRPKKRTRRSAVTLSGLLNILDGVGSEEGKIFFATVSPFFPFQADSRIELRCRRTTSIISTLLSFVPGVLIEKWNTNSPPHSKLQPSLTDSIPLNTLHLNPSFPLRNKSRKNKNWLPSNDLIKNSQPVYPNMNSPPPSSKVTCFHAR